MFFANYCLKSFKGHCAACHSNPECYQRIMENGILAGRSAIKKYRPHIIGAALAILLFVAVQCFTTAFNRHTRKERDLENLKGQVRLLEQNKREQTQKRQALAHVKAFIHRAKTLGLERHKWEHYDVNIEERVYFYEAMRILTQTANSESCYFNPISLNIKKVEGLDPTASGPPQASTGSGNDPQGEDLLLSLKGTFVVRKK